MCGIAGWVDFERDLTGQRDAVEAMSATLAVRGPDDGGFWASPHALLAHRRTAVIDPPGGHQPMVAEQDGRVLAVLTYSGEVYNYRELRTELRGRGHTFRTASDTEVVLRAYLEWGPRCCERLIGMFAFAVWDAVRSELVLVRDRMGIKPLLYQALGDGVVFGSEPKALLAHPQVSPTVDAAGLRELFAQTKTPGVAVYAGMRDLPAGHFARVRPGKGVTEERYWRLESHPHEEDLESTVRSARELLQQVVAEHLVADVPLVSLLSGGIDSSAITALAAGAARTNGTTPPATYSMTFSGYTEGFRPDETRGSADEPYALEAAKHIGTEHTTITLDTADLLDPQTRLATLRAQDLPAPLGDMDVSAYLFSRAVRKDAVVALSGETADEVFGGFPWVHNPRLVQAETFPWVAIGQLFDPQYPGLGCALLSPELLGKLDVVGYTADAYQDAIAEVAPLPGESAQDRRLRELSYLHLTRWLEILLTRGDRLSMALGLELRMPFCDHRFVDYAYNVPWSMKSYDGREKSLLRAAVSDLLPRSVLERRKSPYPVAQDPAYAQALCGQLTELLADADAPVMPFLNRQAAEQAAARPARLANGPGAWLSRTSIEMVLQFNAWLEQYGVRVAL